VRFSWVRLHRGWREFLTEVGIVVLGVLIALAADQWVQSYRNQQDERYTEAALKAELYEAARFAAERLILEKCLSDRLAQVSAKLDGVRGQWSADRLVPSAAGLNRALPVVYRTPKRPWVTDAWQVAVSSATLQYLPKDRVRSYSKLYNFIANLRQTNEQEYASAARLGPLAVDRILNSQQVYDAQVTLSELDAMNTRIVINADQFLNGLKAMRLGYPANDREAALFIAAERQVRGNCVKNLKITI
jgi:hypothetical protein